VRHEHADAGCDARRAIADQRREAAQTTWIQAGGHLLQKVKELTPKPVTMLIDTHTHGDQVSGNVEFPASVEVVAHPNTKANMGRCPSSRNTRATAWSRRRSAIA
jgi:glyoxylase-like metal-dependent hydrolase (beta-lactamase superfamily II)